ncbi:MAG TPA: ribonuclease III [Geobacteraceae bacterium]
MDDTITAALARLEETVGYRFQDRLLLVEALTHRSHVNEAAPASGRDNQRLEFFGDAVLGFLVSQTLLRQFPDKREGELTKLRAMLVDEANLARLASEAGLGPCLLLGKGEERSGGREKRSVLADAYEALVAAVYLDGGLEPAQRLVARQLGPSLAAKVGEGLSHDYKTALQEAVQARGGPAPRYQVTAATGPDHARQFTVTVLVGEVRYGEGSGRTKKEAEQAAANQGLAAIDRLWQR